jgi:uncharacterized phosphosugar-binding protein
VSPSGDGVMEIDGALVGPSSSIAGILVVNAIATEAMKLACAKGVEVPVYHSQNIDGVTNYDLYSKYERWVKHL